MTQHTVNFASVADLKAKLAAFTLLFGGAGVEIETELTGWYETADRRSDLLLSGRFVRVAEIGRSTVSVEVEAGETVKVTAKAEDVVESHEYRARFTAVAR